jgi:hypothetical protein
MIKLINEMKAERFTSLDRGMLRDAKENVVIVSARLDGQRGLSEARTEGAQFSLRVGRLRRLEQMGLAEEKRTGVWAINPGSKYGRQAEALGSWTRRRARDGLSTPITMIATPRCLQDAHTSPRPANRSVLDQHRYHGDDADRGCSPLGERCQDPRSTRYRARPQRAADWRVAALAATILVAEVIGGHIYGSTALVAASAP